MADRAALMLQLTRTLARIPSLEPLPARLCRAYVDVVAARGGSICVGFSTTQRTVLCATSEDAARYEDAQDLVREGPSLDAYRTGDLVGVDTRHEHDRRWPVLSRSVPDEVLGSVRAIPMRPGAAPMGVLTVHHGDGGAPAHEPAELRFLCDAVGAAIIGDLDSAQDQRRLWSQRDRLSQATGMVVAQLDLGPEDALAVLRAHAFAQGTSVAEVAVAVVQRRLQFSDDGSPS